MLLLDDIAGFGGTITSFKGGDSFLITGGTLSSVGVSNGNTLTFADSGVNAGSGGIDQIVFGSAVSAANFNIVNRNTVQVACFAAGTRIETANRPIAVENLIVGDLAVTDDGRFEPIMWNGSRAVNCARHPKTETVWPIRVSAGAFGPGLPVRDLHLSPDHAVFVNRVLVPVKLLADGSTIAHVEWSSVTYYRVELRRHEVIRAEGLRITSTLATEWTSPRRHEPALPPFRGRARARCGRCVGDARCGAADDGWRGTGEGAMSGRHPCVPAKPPVQGNVSSRSYRMRFFYAGDTRGPSRFIAAA